MHKYIDHFLVRSISRSAYFEIMRAHAEEDRPSVIFISEKILFKYFSCFINVLLHNYTQ